jgi:3-hydroxyisobutyrate dehydrogenase
MRSSRLSERANASTTRARASSFSAPTSCARCAVAAKRSTCGIARRPTRVLESEGATAFDEPAAAARGAARIHLTLSDDSAVDDVLERARPGFAPDVVIVDHTTTSPSGTAARAQRWADRGVAFQHAPVFMAPQNALESTGVMLASGDRARFDALQPELGKMTGKLVYVGPRPERAAGFKLLAICSSCS